MAVFKGKNDDRNCVSEYRLHKQEDDRLEGIKDERLDRALAVGAKLADALHDLANSVVYEKKK